ncbi:MAG: hypothetical protein QM621_11270 [Aeromicrobium sp.]|uniref:hypothetical protein n=1 Tax=Aeromicrobium sp. TaxID=1871063 RepID=UPI0039E44CD8
MGWWKRRKATRTDGGAAVSDRAADKRDVEHLREFARSRTGVEAFVEPATSVTQTTLLLVAADGEWTRRRVASPQAAADLARKLEIPVYDTNRVGYPQRMRDYDQRQRAGGGQRATVTQPPASSLSGPEKIAVMTLEVIAGSDPLPDAPSREDLAGLLRQARARAHPDRHGGARETWDKVESAARALGLS